MTGRANALDQRALRDELDLHFAGEHLLLGLGIEPDVACDHLANGTGSDELADADARQRRVIRDHREIAPALADQLVDDPDARAVADDVRMHGELEEPPLGVRGIELAPENVEHVGRRRVRAQRREPVHVEVDRVVTNPLHRKLDYARALAVHQELVAVDVGHER